MAPRPQTFSHYLEKWATDTPTRPAIHGKQAGVWKTLTWQEYWVAARETAKGLIALGHQPGECVGVAAAGTARAGLTELAAAPKVSEYLQSRVEAECDSKVARYQTVKRITVLPVEFSVDGGELTPTMKLRRAAISDTYAEQIAALYEDAPASSPPP